MNQDSIITDIGLAATALAAGIIFILRRWRQLKYERSLHKTALIFNGKVVPQKSFEPPKIVFTYQDVEMSLCYVPMRTARLYLHPPLSCLLARFPRPMEYRMAICPRRGGRIAACRAAADDFVRLSSDHFNAVFREKYDVCSNNHDFAFSVLTQDVQAGLLQCVRYNPVFEYAGETLRVSVPVVRPDEQMNLDLVEASKAVVSRVKQIGDYQ
jgi:hypothetical protein